MFGSAPQFMSSLMPWTTNDFRELEVAINTLAMQADYENRRWAQKWFEAHQFVLGNQSFKWSRQFDFAIDTDFLKNGGDARRNAQTNMSRVVLESLASALYSQLGELVFETKYDATSRGTRLVKVLEAIAECYNERLAMHEELDLGSTTGTLYSKAYAKVWFDKRAGGRFRRPKQQPSKQPKMTTRQEVDPLTGESVTVAVPVLGPDGQPVMYDTFENVVGPDGKPIWEWAPAGDAELEFCTPFEVNRDGSAKTFKKSKWIQHIRVMDEDDFFEEFEGEPGIIEEEFRKIKGGVINANMRNMAFRHFLRAMYSSPPTLDFNGQMSMSTMLSLRNKVLVIEHYDRPSQGHKMRPKPWLKEGRRAITANGRLFLVSTPQYRTAGRADGWHPFLEFKWLGLPPSAQATGPMSDTVAKNREINLTDTLQSLSMQRSAGAHVLVNELSGLDKNKLTGEPGMTHYVTGDPSNAVHFAADKNPIPSAVVNYRQQQKEDIYEVSAALDGQRGERLPNEKSGYHARINEERERKRISKAEANWHNVVSGIYMKLFSCLQQNVVRFDQSVVARLVRSAEGEISEADVMDFLNGPLDFGVDAKVKWGSMRLKSHATQIADAQEMLANQVVAQRLITDPGVVDNLMDFMGITVLRDVTSVHRDRARRENARFYDLINVKNPQQLAQHIATMPVVLWQDDDMVHLIEHVRDFLTNEEKYLRNPALMRAWDVHFVHHEQNHKAKLAEQSPYVASQAQVMVNNAATVGAQPKNLMDELNAFRQQKLMQAAQQQRGNAPNATDAKREPAEADNKGGEK